MHGTSPELQIHLVIFARRFLPTTSKWIFLNLLEQLPILPDILVVLSQQKPPPWRQPQIRNDQRSPICQVLHVQWHEEVRCFGKYLTRPDIPPGRIALRLNSQAIQRTQPFLNVARNADFLLQVAFKVRRTNLQTNGSLLILHLYSIPIRAICDSNLSRRPSHEVFRAFSLTRRRTTSSQIPPA